MTRRRLTITVAAGAGLVLPWLALGRAVRPGVLPSEFGKATVVDAEMVGDLVDDGAADLVGHPLLGTADRADRLTVDGDAVGQHSRVLRRPAGERDALVQAEQAGRARAVLDRHRDVAHQPAEFIGKPVQRCDHHLLETIRIDIDHEPIVHRPGGWPACSRVRPHP
jgi:hypothetical protein